MVLASIIGSQKVSAVNIDEETTTPKLGKRHRTSDKETGVESSKRFKKTYPLNLEEVKKLIVLANAGSKNDRDLLMDLYYRELYTSFLEKNKNDFLKWSNNDDNNPIADWYNSDKYAFFFLSAFYEIETRHLQSQVVNQIQARAQKGESAAQFNLGFMYEQGKGGVEQDIKEAIRFYMLAAKQGYAPAQFAIGGMYDTGRGGLVENEDESLMFYTLAAEQGYAPAQYRLGSMYEYPSSVEENKDEAARFYTLAAEQGHAAAQERLGAMYKKGRGNLDQDDVEAVRLFTLAAEQGDELSQYALGKMYEEGRGGLEKNEEEAVRLYKLADCVENYKRNKLQYLLGRMYEEGRGGLEKNEVEAARLYREANTYAHAPAQYKLGRMYQKGRGGLEENEVKAVELYISAANQGYAPAQYKLGRMYEEGRGGLEKNEVEAVELYISAANHGYAASQYRLGRMYEEGRGGVEKNEVEAVKLYREACGQNGEALKCLACMYCVGKGGLQRNIPHALWLYTLAKKQENKELRLYTLNPPIDKGEELYKSGLMYENGWNGVKRDLDKALKLYENAAKEGNVDAQYRCGWVRYITSEGPETDKVDAIKWFELAAKEGHADAQYGLGFMYEEGRGGLVKDKKEALRLYTLAAEQGHFLAQHALIYQKGYNVSMGIKLAYASLNKEDRLPLFIESWMLNRHNIQTEAARHICFMYPAITTLELLSRFEEILYNYFRNDKISFLDECLIYEPYEEMRDEKEINTILANVSASINQFKDSADIKKLINDMTELSWRHDKAMFSSEEMEDKIQLETLCPSYKFLAEMAHDLTYWLTRIQEEYPPGFLITCLQPTEFLLNKCPKEALGKQGGFSMLQINNQEYCCLGEENPKIGSELRTFLSNKQAIENHFSYLKMVLPVSKNTPAEMRAEEKYRSAIIQQIEEELEKVNHAQLTFERAWNELTAFIEKTTCFRNNFFGKNKGWPRSHRALAPSIVS